MLHIYILIFLLLLVTYFFLKRSRGFPPGPVALPIVGTIHLTGHTPHLACRQLAKQYGPILGLKLGSEWGIMLHGAKLIREAFNENVFSGRLESEATGFLLGDKYGVLQASGDVWMEQRRFAMRTLRDFGFGRNSMEEMIKEEASELCDWLRKQNGVPVELSRRFSLAVVNSLWKILTGERYEHDDKILNSILDQLESTQKLLLDFTNPLKVALLFFYPKISKFFSKYSGWDKLVKTSKSKTELFDRVIQEHVDTLQPKTPRDFVDVYLLEISRTENRNSSFHSTIGKNSLRSVLSDLFLAGSDTTSVTLNWSILYLLHYPKVQENVREEIDRVVGKARLPSLNDRKSMPYTESVLMEVLRMSSIVPIGVSHATIADTEFHGYKIPKGTIVNANIYDAHHDTDTWGDPEIFRPERFHNPDGTCMQRHESLIAFSIGRRVCMGENLARDSLFLFLTMILQSFKIEVAADEKKPTLDPLFGKITLQPQKYQISMKLVS